MTSKFPQRALRVTPFGVRRTLRQLLRAVDSFTAAAPLADAAHWKEQVMTQYRLHKFTQDADRVALLQYSALEYVSLLEGIGGHQKALTGAGWLLNETEEKARNRVAGRVGLTMPQVYDPENPDAAQTGTGGGGDSNVSAAHVAAPSASS